MSTTFSRSFRFFLFDAEIRHSFLLYDKVYNLARNNDLLYDLLALDGVLYLFLCQCGIDRSLLVRIGCQLDGALQLAVYLYRQLYRALDGLGLVVGRPRCYGEQTGLAELLPQLLSDMRCKRIEQRQEGLVLSTCLRPCRRTR